MVLTTCVPNSTSIIVGPWCCIAQIGYGHHKVCAHGPSRPRRLTLPCWSHVCFGHMQAAIGTASDSTSAWKALTVHHTSYPAVAEQWLPFAMQATTALHYPWMDVGITGFGPYGPWETAGDAQNSVYEDLVRAFDAGYVDAEAWSGYMLQLSIDGHGTPWRLPQQLMGEQGVHARSGVVCNNSVRLLFTFAAEVNMWVCRMRVVMAAMTGCRRSSHGHLLLCSGPCVVGLTQTLLYFVLSEFRID